MEEFTKMSAAEKFLKDCPRSDQDAQIPGEKRSAFTVSDDVMGKITSKEEAVSKGETTLWKEFAKLEKSWREIERQIDMGHDIKVGTDPGSIDALEASIMKDSTMKCPCACGEPVLECIDEKIEMPLQCHHLVRDYIRCVAKYTAAVSSSIAQNK